jgi:hypothetical protein
MEVIKLIDQKEVKEVKNFQQANSQVTQHLNDIGTK